MSYRSPLTSLLHFAPNVTLVIRSDRLSAKGETKDTPSSTINKTVVFLGSARSGGQLCDQVTTWVKSTLALRLLSLGNDAVTHAVKVIDPIDVFGPGGALSHSGAELRLPTHFGPDLALGPKTLELRAMINAADCYLIISPEYNQTIPPALSSLMGHFGGSSYICKPAGIITYSPGLFAGMRAAMAIQIMCHELGCLPVSKLCGLPFVNDLLNEDGTPKGEDQRMLTQLPDLLDQVEWMAAAMKARRDKTGTF